MASNSDNSICCPQFDPIPWDDKTFTWTDKRFIKDHVCTFFYMPMNFGSVMKRLDKKVTTSNAAVLNWLCLSDHTTKWNMDVYLAVDKEVADAENLVMNGTFFSKVYEGPFKETGNWGKDFEALLKSRGLQKKKLYMWYTTCPKCAKKYGKNYVVFVAQV